MHGYFHSRFLERFFYSILLLSLVYFAYYFTATDLEEIQSRFEAKQITLIKVLSREIADLIGRQSNITPKLANFLVEESVAYAVVQMPTGEVLAKAENPPIAVGTLFEQEKIALGISHMNLHDFSDPSGTVPLTEAAMPLITDNYGKIIVRLGFFRKTEEDALRTVRFRNLLVFSIIAMSFFMYWLVRRKAASGFQTTLLGGSIILLLLMFFLTRMILQVWYETHWRRTFVKHGMTIAKMAAPASLRFLQSGDEQNIKEMHALLESDETFGFLGIIKDEQYLFHSDPEKKGEFFKSDTNYAKSLNTDSPILFALDEDNLYEVLVPILEGNHRLGTLRISLRNVSGYGPLKAIRNRLILTFLAALIVILMLTHSLGRRVSRDVTRVISAMEHVTAGDLRQKIFIDRDDEFGQLAQAFNFMIMGLRERDLLGKGLQHYVSKSIVEKTLKVLSSEDQLGEKGFCASIMIHFGGLKDAVDLHTAQKILESVRELYQTLKRICPPSSDCQLKIQLSGILILFSHGGRPEITMRAVNAADMLLQTLGNFPDLPFSPKLTLHTFEAIHGSIDDNGPMDVFLGEGNIDFKAFSQVQDTDEIICSEEAYFLLKDVAAFDELELTTGEQSRITGHLFRGFLPIDHLLEIFPDLSAWSKILVLKIIQGNIAPENVYLLMDWFSSNDEKVRYYIMEALEKITGSEIIDFTVRTIREETAPRVLAKAISVLGKIGDESHVPILAEKLRMPDRRVKANAIEALEAIGGKNVYDFLNLLVDEQDNRVKANILIAMGKYGDLKVFELLSHMIKDPDKNMRASAAFALGRLGMAQGVEPLICALSDKDPMVRRQVVASLTALKADLDLD